MNDERLAELQALADEVVERNVPTEIPPCRVCGGPLSIGSIGGGEPTKWSCSIQEDDPDNPGKLRVKEGRGKPGTEFGPGGHYSESGFVDRRHTDSKARELAQAVPELIEAVRERDREIGRLRSRGLGGWRQSG